MSHQQDFGNRITANAAKADDGRELIQRALKYVESTYGFSSIDHSSLFSGVYYDSKKVGSFIAKVKDKDGNMVVLKLQLHPLPFDEGFIIRHIEQNLKTNKMRPVKILHDQPWSEALGFGYVVFEDISSLPNLWNHTPTEDEDRNLHKKFIEEFYASVLPIKSPWIEKPQMSIQEKLLEAFKHFQEIAKNSSHKHIREEDLTPFIDTYLTIIASEKINPEITFTHGHLSGYDVKYDEQNNQFILMANLYWSWRPKYYERVFPIWVDLMHIQNASLPFEEFLTRVMAWVHLWPKEITNSQAFWFLLLERSMLTIMLDLGASEWKNDEKKEKQALLESWKLFFHWIVENKMK